MPYADPEAQRAYQRDWHRKRLADPEHGPAMRAAARKRRARYRARHPGREYLQHRAQRMKKVAA